MVVSSARQASSYSEPEVPQKSAALYRLIKMPLWSFPVVSRSTFHHLFILLAPSDNYGAGNPICMSIVRVEPASRAEI